VGLGAGPGAGVGCPCTQQVTKSSFVHVELAHIAPGIACQPSGQPHEEQGIGGGAVESSLGMVVGPASSAFVWTVAEKRTQRRASADIRIVPSFAG